MIQGISVVVPVFGDGGRLAELVRRVGMALRPTCGSDWEVVLVNDGSPQSTWREITRLAEHHPNVCGINLLRNFGQHNALLAGILHSTGAVIVTIDDDLQQPPEAIPALVSSLDNADVSYGRPTNRASGVLRQVSGKVFRLVLGSVPGLAHVRHFAPLRAFRGTLKTGFENYRSPHVSIDALLAQATTRVTTVPVQYEFRRAGASGQTIRSLFSLAMTMMRATSVWPRRLVTMGVARAFFGTTDRVPYVIDGYTPEIKLSRSGTSDGTTAPRAPA